MPAKGVGVKVIVVAGGDAAPEDAAQLSDVDLVIAADSGAQWLDLLGREPDLLVGDMDSIDPLLLQRLTADGVAIERHAVEKDASDVELAVERAVSAGADEVVILGGIGADRLDHELANLLLLADPRWHGLDLRFVRGRTTLRAVRGGGARELDGTAGDLVTLLPVGGDAMGVRTTGLRYPLAGETLTLGRTRGLSNEVVQAPASVSLDAGTLLVIETGKEPPR
ncbi:MAG: thiamine diphosphokinase [Candidatus Limnocylindria bacterium]